MDIIAEIEKLRQEIALQRTKAARNWESGGDGTNTPIGDISEDKAD